MVELVSGGPLVVSFEPGLDFSYYSSGVYRSTQGEAFKDVNGKYQQYLSISEPRQQCLGSEDHRGGLGDHLERRGSEDHPSELRGAGRGGPPQPGGQNDIFGQ